jgi:neutral ceramidase
LGLSDSYSTEVIGRRQFLKARDIVNNPANTPLSTTGPVRYAQAWVDMSNVQVKLPDGSTGSTCTPSMGYAFSAGTTDGIATPISWQGDNSTTGTNKLVNIVRDVIAKPTEELQKCHLPKPILLNTGETRFPYDWQPRVIPLQLFIVGRKFVVIGQPSEITTMAGRRLRESTLKTLVETNIVDSDARIVISGLSNTYSSYVTTREEYQVQRYEGASTIFGPNTLLAYQKMYTQLALGFSNPLQQLPKGSPPSPPESEWSLLTDVVLDTGKFGQVIDFKIVRPTPGNSLGIDGSTSQLAKVVAVFACAHPRNGGKLLTPSLETFMSVEIQNPGGGSNNWETLLTDAEWDTKFIWRREGVAESRCTVTWDAGRTYNVVKGRNYRLKIFGRSKNLLGQFESYEGQTEAFMI